MVWFTFIEGLGVLAASIIYLFDGFSLGTVQLCSSLFPYEKGNELENLTCLLMKGSSLFSVLYFTIIIIVDMYYGYYDEFILPTSLLALMCLAYLLVVLAVAKNNKDVLEEGRYSLACILFHTLLIIKLSHTSYFMIDNTIHYELSTTKIKWRISLASIILEFFQLMAWTLIPFLWYPNSKR